MAVYTPYEEPEEAEENSALVCKHYLRVWINDDEDGAQFYEYDDGTNASICSPRMFVEKLRALANDIERTLNLADKTITSVPRTKPTPF